MFRRVILSGAAILWSATSGAETSSHVVHYSTLHEHAQYNDVWGYTAPNGDEYVLLGTTTGLSVVNITDRVAPYETGFVPGPTSVWRDIKTYGSHAYVTNESSGGLAIIDLSDPENPEGLASYTGFSTAHNLFIEESTARCYIAGSNLGSGGVRILSLANPTAPSAIGNWETEYFHDVVVLDHRVYGSAINDDTLYVLDATNASSPTVLGSVGNYPSAFTHNAWMTADNQYVLTTDELVGASCRMWDVSNLPTITQVDAYRPVPTSIPHNAHIRGDYAYISHYTIGVRVLDVSDPANLVEVGFYDTFPAGDGGTYDGCWGVYPFFPNSPGLMVVSDIDTGLWILEFSPEVSTVSGLVTKTGEPSTEIVGARVEVLESGVSTVTAADGTYSLATTPGTIHVQISAFGYESRTVPIVVVADTAVDLDVSLDPVPGGTLSGVVLTQALAPIDGAEVSIDTTPLVEFTDGVGAYSHRSVPVGNWVAGAWAFGFDRLQTTVGMSDGADLSFDFSLPIAFEADDFEAPAAGWTVSGNATGGVWERADPEGTAGGTVQPEDDHTPDPGVNAWVTGAAAGTGVGGGDVDGGSTILTSPVFDVTGMSLPHLRYWRWYVSGYTTNPSRDPWIVEVSANAGATWTEIENTDTATPAWLLVDIEIASVVPVTSQFRVRFTAKDVGTGSITEAAVDDFTIYDVATAAATGGFAVADEPLAFGLGEAFPNPFRAGQAATWDFVAPRGGPASIDVFDVAGRRVATLIDGPVAAGPHRATWDGRSSDGRSMPAGVYFVRLKTAEGSRSGRVLLLR